MKEHYYLLQRLFNLFLIGMRSKIIDIIITIDGIIYESPIHFAFHKNHVYYAERFRTKHISRSLETSFSRRKFAQSREIRAPGPRARYVPADCDLNPVKEKNPSVSSYYCSSVFCLLQYIVVNNYNYHCFSKHLREIFIRLLQLCDPRLSPLGGQI